jgi:hypothetical protein
MSAVEVPATPDAAFLSAVLRDPSRWPAGFEWDYSHCAMCAVGMASLLWNREVTPGVMSAETGIDFHVVVDAFYNLDEKHGVSMGEITPSNVADALDAAIASQVQA